MNPLLLPVVVAQGLWVRGRTGEIPAAAGPVTGVAAPPGTQDSAASAWRIAVVGESTAAGCGAATHDEGFAGSLARELAGRTGRRVEWSVAGEHGATMRRIRDALLPRLGRELDVAVLLAGVNDVVGHRAPGAWGDDLAAVVDDLGGRAGRVAVAGIAPFDGFPAMPGVLGRYLAERGRALDEVARRVCAARPGALWIDARSLLPMGAEFFARDRFHPSAYGYSRWAAVVADRLAPEQADRLAPE